MLPVFYTRCLQTNYPEGHIQTVRMFVKALDSLSTHPAIFDFEYGDNHPGLAPSSSVRVRRFRFVSAEGAISGRAGFDTAATLLFEAVSSLHFGGVERRAFGTNRDVIVNLTNCFRYTRLLDPRPQNPLLLHYYMREPSCRLLGSWLSKNVDGFLASSHSLKQYLISQCQLSKKKIKVTYPPVDTSIYRPLNKVKVRQTLGIGNDRKIALYMGGLKEARFPLRTIVETLSEVAHEFPSVLLLVATPDRPEERQRAEYLLRAAEKLGLSEKILIQIRNLNEKEKNALYALSDLFIYPASQPSMAIEPPLTVLESMASGTPILAFGGPSVKEVIGDPECGEMTYSFEATSLSHALMDLLSDQDRLRTLSTNCREVALAKFSLQVSGMRLLEWFTEILNDYHHG